jgi:DNA-binding NarL/FixJ family response regulator
LARLCVRVLVVDDFEPVRNLICSKVQNDPKLQVVWQASNGLEAVEKAEEYQPELILLDISLPKLNGLEAARRIFRVSPLSKIIFVSQESTKEVIEEAIRIGAKGYIVKTDISHELLPGIGAVLRGEIFISSHISDSKSVIGKVSHPSKTTARHEVSFYADDASLVDGLSCCMKGALDAGRVAVGVVTDSHRASLLRELRANGIEVDKEMEQGRLVVMSVAETRVMFSLDDRPDASRFTAAARKFIDTIAIQAKSEDPKAVLCGECAATLLAEGEVDAAIHLEQLLNQFCGSCADISIQCAYLSNGFEGDRATQLLESICSQHSAVLGR